VDGVAGQPAGPRAIQETANGEPGTEAGEEGADRMPGTLESSEGGAPEITVHKEEALADTGELSPEEQALNVPQTEPTPAERLTESEDDDAAALAEGRVAPPVAGREETA
jgi:hypothetical protein